MSIDARQIDRAAGLPNGRPPATTPPRVGFVSLGCAKNLVDTQTMAGMLIRSGMRLASAPERADVLLVNTCAFIEDAREEAAESILWACEQKRVGSCRVVVVCGCLPQRYRSRMRRAFPEVDGLVGVDELDRVAEVVGAALAGRRTGFRARRAGPPRRLFAAPVPGLALTGGPFAYLKVAEGCRHACAYCAIPSIRGRLRSHPPERLETEARALLRAGFRELNLVSQDTGGYGADLPGSDGLAGLLQRLDALRGDFWLRLLYLYPTSLGDGLFGVMAAARHVCRYVDVPIQHSHPEILRAMRRADTIVPLEDLAARTRAALPGVVLRTTCLVGFPGETDAHFEHLCRYLEAARFDHLGVFVYSPEAGTAAFARSAPPHAVALERCALLMAQQRRRVRHRLRDRLDTEAVVLLENRYRSGGAMAWRSRGADQAPEADGHTRVFNVPVGDWAGRFARVRIMGARGYDVRAEWQAWSGASGA